MKRLMTAALLLALGLTLSACGNDEVKVIEKTADVQEGAENAENTAEENAAEEAPTVESKKAASGFSYEASYNGKTITLYADMDMQEVLDVIGEPATYFEAASCAFQGLDKIYTYDHFEIDTYPNGEQDLVSAIVILDDLVTTPEGAYIGQSLADVEAIYGTDHEVNGSSYTYTKDGSKLEFVLTDDSVSSISISSTVLD